MREVRSRTYESLDLWRGFAAILVVLFHCIANITSEPARAQNTNFFVDFCLWGDVGVSLFFVISGYCISAAAANTMDRGQQTRQFLVARLRRIFPTYLASLFLFILAAGMAWFAQRSGTIGTSKLAEMFTSLTPRLVLTNSLLIQVPLKEESITLVSWSLCYELSFYAIVAVSIFAFRKQGWQVMVKALHCVTLIALTIATFAPQWASFPFDRWICFGEGVLLFDMLCGQPWANRTRQGRGFLLVVISLVSGLVATKVFYAGEGYHAAWNVAIGSVFAVVLYYLHPFDRKVKQTKLLSGIFFVGSISYSVYLIHVLVIGLFRQIAKKIQVPIHWFGLEMAAELIVIFVASYIFYRLVESRFMSHKQRVATVN
ncbi:MAG: acyltransferase [Akkermansiaceae bacterium]|nr:acyltransferase [Armatimonadota bacterium]